MNVEQIKKMMDACYLAKRVREMLPKLPQGVAPSYIQYLDVIQKLERQKGDVKVSDISDVLELPRPGVTRTVKEMEAKGYLRKTSSREDGRITYITITLHFIHQIGVVFWAYPITWSISSVLFAWYIKHCPIPRLGGGAPE